MWNGNDVIATYSVITGKVVKLGNISKSIFVYKVCFLNIWKFGTNPNASFRETTHVPQWRHNVSDKKSYTEVHTSDNHQVHHQIFSSYNQTVWPGHQLRSTHACMHEKKYKGTHFSTGPTTSSRHSNKIIYVLCRLQVITSFSQIKYSWLIKKLAEFP